MFVAIRFTLLILVSMGLLYPLALTGLGQAFFPQQANGSLIHNATGQTIGSSLIGQAFTRPEYFHPRPAANGYDAANSGGSNLGPTSKKLIDRITVDTSGYQQKNGAKQPIPVDAVTASASNLDPHISVANALRQVPRVAHARNVSPKRIKALVLQLTEKPLFSEAPYLNVLTLNLALETKNSF
ncbi:MAG: potassium-transporting ATPase subunit KdpC [Vampirovibrionales bacterium]|nr:potassium-transporting ATPase subunit KdpC [Vampirovibrionales bacterium]